MTHWINYIFIAILTGGLFLQLISDSRRINLAAFSGTLLMAFVINIQFWSFTFALSKLITGLMAILILNLSPNLMTQSLFEGSRTSKVFRGVAFAFLLILILFIVPKSSIFLSIPLEQTLAALFMMVSGFVTLGISQNPYRVILGLIVLFLGFEIIYGSVESSLLINGMLAAVDLLVALIGSYLITNSLAEEEQ
jgi:hypothetical protein